MGPRKKPHPVIKLLQQRPTVAPPPPLKTALSVWGVFGATWSFSRNTIGCRERPSRVKAPAPGCDWRTWPGGRGLVLNGFLSFFCPPWVCRRAGGTQDGRANRSDITGHADGLIPSSHISRAGEGPHDTLFTDSEQPFCRTNDMWCGYFCSLHCNLSELRSRPVVGS